MTRAQIADPNLARRARAGEPITRCIGCNQGCIGHYHAGVPIACTVNPWAGYERRLPLPAPAERPGTVVVVGAGPAGCAAAASAAARGHRVVVFERAERPGGQMRLALAAPGPRRGRRGAARDPGATGSPRVGRPLRRRGVAADVLAERPDRVVVATGADPYVPAIGGDGVGVVDAWAALAGCSGRRPRGRAATGAATGPGSTRPRRWRPAARDVRAAGRERLGRVEPGPVAAPVAHRHAVADRSPGEGSQASTTPSPSPPIAGMYASAPVATTTWSGRSAKTSSEDASAP